MVEMRIDQIQHAGDTQIRMQLDFYAVDDYVRAMQEGDVFPPVDVFFDGETYWLADGFHRIDATGKLNKDTISATVHEGSKRDAILFAVDKNRRYGVRLSNKDKQRMVKMFLTDEVLAEQSNYEIAKRCSVSESLVRTTRNFIYVLNVDKKSTTRKATRNGTTYTVDTENIGKTATAEAEQSQETLFESTAEPAEVLTLVDAPVQYEAEPVEAATVEETIALPVEPEAAIVEPVAIQRTSRIDIINADSQYLSQVVDRPVQLVITSPPYNVGIEYDSVSDDLSTYIPLVTSVWKECYKVMQDGARIAVVVPFGVGRNPYIPFDCQIMNTLIEAGFTLRGRIVWDKNTTGGRTSWGSWRLPSAPSIRDTTECIIVAHKGSSSLEIPSAAKLKDDKSTYSAWLADGDYFMELAQDHWVIAPESAKRVKHPAPFPVELVERLMHFYAYPGAHVLDPFGGSGTVAVAAQKLGCDATIVEISQQYCELAKGRLSK